MKMRGETKEEANSVNIRRDEKKSDEKKLLEIRDCQVKGVKLWEKL